MFVCLATGEEPGAEARWYPRKPEECFKQQAHPTDTSTMTPSIEWLQSLDLFKEQEWNIPTRQWGRLTGYSHFKP